MREPDPMRECRPGGTCPECNPPDPVCPWCGECPVETEGAMCSECVTSRAEREAEAATIAALKADLRSVQAQESALATRRYELQLAIEEAEGRPDSRDARFARAALARDTATMTRLCAERDAAYHREFGHWPQQEIRDEAERIAKGERHE